MERDQFLNKIELSLEEYAQNRLTECNCKMMGIIRGTYKPEMEDDLIDLVSETNSWVNYFSGENDDLYEKYSYKLFKGSTGYYIAQGEEIYDVHIRYR